jgi:hypothetical protein
MKRSWLQLRCNLLRSNLTLESIHEDELSEPSCEERKIYTTRIQ